MVRINTQREINYMRFKIKNLLIIILICNFSTISKSANEDDIYKKILYISISAETTVLDKQKIDKKINKKSGYIYNFLFI